MYFLPYRYYFKKSNRLSGYDYTKNGAYFITISSYKLQNIFATVVEDIILHKDILNKCDIHIPKDFVKANVVLSEIGQLIESSIKNIPKIYPEVFVDDYVILPNHIHMILLIDHGRAERIISSQHEMNETQNPTPNLSVIVGQMKRYVSKKVGQNIWRESFHDHIIRDIIEYNELSEYLKNNIRLWKYDEYYRK